MLTADDRAQIRAELDPAQQAERWRSLSLWLLDELEAAEAKRGDCTECRDELNIIEAACMNAGIDRKNLTVFGMVSKLADAYRTEKERADRLQRDNETLRAARESLVPVGFIWRDDNNSFWFRRNLDKNSAPAPISDFAKQHESRRVYLAPPQPLEESC